MSYERFVEIPGIVDIKWVSDNPDYYVAPIDLFDEQANGIPEWYGKKDKATTEQAYFTCNPCDCDLKSVITLRAHCKGTQHIRKALQKKREFNNARKKEAESRGRSQDNESFLTLPDVLENTREHIVGLEYVTELERGPNDVRYYHCSLLECREEQGGPSHMAEHLQTLRHRQAWLQEVEGEYLPTMQELMQAIAKLRSNTSRDYRDMQTVKDPYLWRYARDGKLRWKDIKKEQKREEDYDQRSPERSGASRPSKEYGRNSNCFDYRGKSMEKDARSSYQESKDGRSSYPESKDARSIYRESDSPQHSDRTIHSSSSMTIKRDLDAIRDNPSYDRSPKRVRRNSGDVEEVSRSGNFSNWRTEVIKTDRSQNENSESSALSSGRLAPSIPGPSRPSVDDDVARLHKRVAEKVMKALNIYYPGANEFMGETKIGSPEEYSHLAKKFSHQIRNSIKESYTAFEGSLEGIRLTPDNEQYIRTEIDSYFESIDVIRPRKH